MTDSNLFRSSEFFHLLITSFADSFVFDIKVLLEMLEFGGTPVHRTQPTSEAGHFVAAVPATTTTITTTATKASTVASTAKTAVTIVTLQIIKSALKTKKDFHKRTILERKMKGG
jgi:hypothetical protein